MFGDAFELASQFTRPIAVSRLAWNGKCSNGMGSFILLNDQGWVLTAGHIVDQIVVMDRESSESAQHEAKIDAIEKDSTLDAVQKRAAKKKLGLRKPDSTRRFSPLWDMMSAAQAISAVRCPVADIGIVQLQNFDKTLFKVCPKLKDPSKKYRPGTSLCKLGFPFHTVQPSWDEATGTFSLPAGSWPPPFFPMDGILTRVANIDNGTSAPVVPYAAKLIETSSPGLRGQSGGPIFDSAGNIWAIQCHTSHFSLGFDPIVPESKQKVHQFLNVGYGVHIETVIGFLTSQGIAFTLSDN